MSSHEAMENASLAGAAARRSGALAVVVLLYGLAQSGEALAGDSSADVVKDIQPIVGGKPLPSAFAPGKSPAGEAQFSPTEFGPRKFSTDASAPAEVRSSYPAEPLQATSAWQRLADYRSQGRVQLLTLWQSPRSTLSLQAGKHGGPSLQWSSRLTNHGAATRGLLDRFVGLSSKIASRNFNAGATTGKTINLIPAAKAP